MTTRRTADARPRRQLRRSIPVHDLPRPIVTGSSLARDVVAAFEQLGLPLVEDGPGRWHVQLPASARRPALALWVDAEAEGRVLALRAAPVTGFSSVLRAELLEAVNQWHLIQRWPRLYVSNDLDRHIVEADAHVVVAEGADAASIAGAVATLVSGCMDFWDVFSVPEDETAALEGIARIVDRGWDD